MKVTLGLLLYVLVVSYSVYYVFRMFQGRETIETMESAIHYGPNCHVDNASALRNSISTKESQTAGSYDTPFLKDLGKYDINQYDYNNVVYPIPFSKLYNDYTTHYKHFNKPNPLFPSFVLTGPIPTFHEKSSDLLMVTGASDNHAVFSFNLLYSMILTDPYASILYIDLDMTLENRQLLSTHFKTIHEIQQKMDSTGFLAYRILNWNSFPDWMNLFKSGPSLRGAYSWKVVPIYDAFKEWKGLLTWLDAGCMIVDRLSREFTLARRYGVYTPESLGDVHKWCYIRSQQFLLEHRFVNKINQTAPMGMGGVLFLSYQHPTARALMQRYIDCAYTRKCIGPIGSSRDNHRQDQSVLTLLAHHFKVPIKKIVHPSFQNDNNKPPFYQHSLENYMLAIQHDFHIKFSNQYIKTNNLKYRQLNYSHIYRTVDN